MRFCLGELSKDVFFFFVGVLAAPSPPSLNSFLLFVFIRIGYVGRQLGRYLSSLSLGLCKLNLVNYIEGFVSCLSFTTRQGVWQLLFRCLWLSLSPSLSLSCAFCFCTSCCPSCPSCSWVSSAFYGIIIIIFVCEATNAFFMTFYGDL